jgi:DNA repair exonuclease SbcCD ATPase subunit
MRRDTLLPMAALLALAGVSALAAPAQQPAGQQSTDPVADAARKARAEKQAASKPKKIYTDDDFASTKNPNPPPAAKTDGDGQAITTDQAATDANKTKDASVVDDPKSEAYWRKRFRSVRDKIEQAESELSVLQRELNKDQVQYYNDPQKALMQQYDRKDINDKTAKVDAKRKQIEDLKKQLSDMEDELRKAGGDPGWAR